MNGKTEIPWTQVHPGRGIFMIRHMEVLSASINLHLPFAIDLKIISF